MKQKRRVSRLSKWYAWVALAILVLNPVSLMLILSILHNAHDTIVMQRFAQPFFDYPLPEQTEEIEQKVYMGSGGAHGCSYIAERYIRSTLTQEELEAYFEPTHFPMPFGEENAFSRDGLLHPFVKEAEGYYIVSIGAGGLYTFDDILPIGCRQH